MVYRVMESISRQIYKQPDGTTTANCLCHCVDDDTNAFVAGPFTHTHTHTHTHARTHTHAHTHTGEKKTNKKH